MPLADVERFERHMHSFNTIPECDGRTDGQTERFAKTVKHSMLTRDRDFTRSAIYYEIEKEIKFMFARLHESSIIQFYYC